MKDMDVYAVFGLEAPADNQENQPAAGEQEQEVADPADTGEQEQEVAEPATSDAEDAEQEDPVQDQTAEKPPLTKVQKAEQARQRREQEKQQAVENARVEERKALDARLQAFFAQAKIEDPINGGIIETLEGAEKWLASMQSANLQRNLKQGRLTQEDLQALIEASPAMQRAKTLVDKVEAEAKAFADAEFARNVEKELEAIRKMDPKIQSLTDIIQLPTGRRFVELVNIHNLTYEDAFRLANIDRLQQQASKVAAAGARISSGGKDHLKRTDMRGKGGADVTGEQAAAYRIFQPDLTDDQIQKDYEKRVRSV